MGGTGSTENVCLFVDELKKFMRCEKVGSGVETSIAWLLEVDSFPLLNSLPYLLWFVALDGSLLMV